jgi:hypothetical protein
MFSKNHINIWRNHWNRKKFQDCLDNGAKNPIQIKTVFLCFGCKLYFRNDNTPHTCPNKEKTLTFVKSILDVPAIKSEPKAPEAQGPPLPSPAPEPVIVSSPKNALDTKMLDLAFGLEAVLINMLNDVRTKSFNLFVNQMLDIKNSNPDIFNHLFKELDLDEEEFPTMYQELE